PALFLLAYAPATAIDTLSLHDALPIFYWEGGHLVLTKAITIGTLGAFTIYVTQLYSPLTQLTNSRVDLLTAFVSFERVFEILDIDRKSTRLNSSHVSISYAVFCLKKKT